MALGVLALAAAAAAAFFSLRRRQRQRRRREGEHGSTAPGGGGRLDYKSELDAQNYKIARSEMAGDSEPVVHEKDSAPVAQTMMGELEAPR